MFKQLYLASKFSLSVIKVLYFNIYRYRIHSIIKSTATYVHVIENKTKNEVAEIK